ncbi:phospholipase [Sulfurimonas aquatica]|uniref:Phosphatidylcholine 1-acylhydrolase n=1 Tax=Sulfurimonas aquatica TaxID=2672570 RepID=A0A975AXY4_9BACT|nr:phospholipase A [Sulfurimonas aquatica]QSZ40588.1 phospholipase [Sulfurimonas aquatica]
MKLVLLLLFLLLSLQAETKGFKKEVYGAVNSDIEQNNDELFSTLSWIEDTQTKKTIFQHSHSVFNIKSHHENYLLPLSARINGNYDDSTKIRDTYNMEVEFQVSVKYSFFPNLLGLGELYSVAYTQHSFWQYYVGDAFFRTSDYNPEFFVTLPLKTEYAKAIRLAYAHKSNGLGVPHERAWNYVTLSTYFQYRSIFAELALWTRVSDNYDYNPALVDTMGRGHLKFLFPYKKHLLTTLFRDNFKDRGAIDIRYSYPLFGESLFLYVKGFMGYGESMSSYAGNSDYAGQTPQEDDYVEKIAIGFSLSR